MGLGWLGNHVGLNEGVMALIASILGLYARKKIKEYKGAAKSSAEGIAAIEGEYPEAAQKAKDVVRKNECKGTPLDTIVKGVEV